MNGKAGQQRQSDGQTERTTSLTRGGKGPGGPNPPSACDAASNEPSPTWADCVSCLDHARRRDWPLVRVRGELLDGEAAWRGWVRRADKRTLIEMRELLASGAEPDEVRSA